MASVKVEGRQQPLDSVDGTDETPSGDNRWRPLVLAAMAAALPIVVITAVLVLHYGGKTTTDRVSEAGQALAALAAALSLAGAAWRAPSRTRWSWILLSVSAASVFLGQVIEEVGQEEVFPTPAEIGLLIGIPFASAGLLIWPKVQRIYASRLHAILDFLMVAFSLAFVVLGFGLLQDYTTAAGPAGWLGPLFPAGYVLLLTVVFVKLRRSRPTRPGRLALLLIGFSVNVLSDSASTIFAAVGAWPSIRTLVGSAEIYGFTLVALAPLWPRGVERKKEEETALWRVLLPYVGVVAVLSTAIGSELIAHRPLPSSVDAPAAGLVVVLIASQVLSFVEGRTLLRQSREAEARVKARETMLQNVIDHAPQGVARITRDRRIANANPRLASILYTPRRLVEGASLESFLPHDDVERAFSSIAQTADESEETIEADSQVRRANGGEFWMHWSLTPIRLPNGSIDYYMAMFEDVTAQREREEISAANLQQMEKLNRLKSEFVSMVSHEFRTALVGIQGFSELIRDQDLEPSDAKTLAGDINDDAQRLNRMIGEMLEFDRLEAGKVPMHVMPIDINPVLLEAVERAQVTTTKHVVTPRLDGELPRVMGDSDRITQVLGNLLSNAIKYSPDGGQIVVRSRLEGGFVEVSVKDQGLGIPPEFIGRLFGRYERYEDQHVGKIIGTGLGLAITRQIVEMHGGKISVESTVGNGSEFKFTVPVAVHGTLGVEPAGTTLR